jgi:hypothetical protein
MNEPTTGQVVDPIVADNSSTTIPTTNPADSQVTENASSNTSEATSNASAETNKTEDEDGAALAKFAKGQGINDLSELTERELSLLKMARDNKSAFDKSKQTQPKLDESSKELSKLGEDATVVEQLAAKVQAMEYGENKKAFFSGKDVTLEPVMAQIVATIRDSGDENYARKLVNDLPMLYSLAQIGRGSTDTTAAIEEAKKEERNSMNKSLAAGASDAHATNSKPATPIKVTSEWIRNEYNPNNPEHRALVDAMTKR